MCTSDKTYTPITSDLMLQAVGGIKNGGIALFAARLTVMPKNKDGDVCVSILSLCQLFTCSKNTIKDYAKKLSVLGVWHMTSGGNGRGDMSIWKKGSNFDTYMTIKRGQTLTEKGSNIDPNNIDNNKECAKGAHTCVSAAHCASKNFNKEMQGDTPCDPQAMDDPKFKIFWEEFHANPEYERDEKARCAGIFALMSQELQNDIIMSLRAYNRRPNRFDLRAKKDNPRFYLFDYVPKSLKLAAKGTEVTYQEYVKFYQTDLEYDGWKRIHIPAEQRTIFRKES